MRSTFAFQTTLWLILLAARLVSCESSSQHCPASRPYAISFSVVSRRNMTGHWKSELKMQNNGGSDVSGNKEDGPWEVDLVQTSEMTKSGEIFTVTAVLEDVLAIVATALARAGQEDPSLCLEDDPPWQNALSWWPPALTERGAKLAKVEGCPSCQEMTGLTAGTRPSVSKSLAAHVMCVATLEGHSRDGLEEPRNRCLFLDKWMPNPDTAELNKKLVEGNVHNENKVNHIAAGVAVFVHALFEFGLRHEAMAARVVALVE
uniref:Uncharacterized protein n=1 Tax=Timema bartmani TaxID=61472 RepID=A0A7R9EVG2_9NEOP|nr:unnamed protein product [Timema bartmani]